MMSEISVLGIDAANLLSITLGAFSGDLHVALLLWPSAALTPRRHKDDLNESKHHHN